MPLGAVGDRLVHIFRGQDIGDKDSRFLQGRDVNADAVVDVGGVKGFLGDEFSDTVRDRPVAIEA